MGGGKSNFAFKYSCQQNSRYLGLIIVASSQCVLIYAWNSNFMRDNFASCTTNDQKKPEFRWSDSQGVRLEYTFPKFIFLNHMPHKNEAILRKFIGYLISSA